MARRSAASFPAAIVVGAASLLGFIWAMKSVLAKKHAPAIVTPPPKNELRKKLLFPTDTLVVMGDQGAERLAYFMGPEFQAYGQPGSDLSAVAVPGATLESMTAIVKTLNAEQGADVFVVEGGTLDLLTPPDGAANPVSIGTRIDALGDELRKHTLGAIVWMVPFQAGGIEHAAYQAALLSRAARVTSQPVEVVYAPPNVQKDQDGLFPSLTGWQEIASDLFAELKRDR